ncbi:hypothetical protein MUO83_09575 [Candidatus Bathyarchaeota archaeon]|nr:hypothetical protein [Candidatus Bathyarchaeota archaeon]
MCKTKEGNTLLRVYGSAMPTEFIMRKHHKPSASSLYMLAACSRSCFTEAAEW